MFAMFGRSVFRLQQFPVVIAFALCFAACGTRGGVSIKLKGTERDFDAGASGFRPDRTEIVLHLEIVNDGGKLRPV